MRILLERGEAMPLRGVAGRTLRAHAGRVWITEAAISIKFHL